MSCPHATTTTLQWLYGEGDEAHAEHVASCAECQVVVAEHADVMSALEGVSHLDLEPSADAPVRPANRPMWRAVAMAVAAGLLAAAVLFVVPMRPSSPDPVDLTMFDAPLDDPLEERFDALAWELGDLEADVEGDLL